MSYSELLIVTGTCLVIFLIAAAYQIGYTRGAKMMGKYASDQLDELKEWVKSSND